MKKILKILLFGFLFLFVLILIIPTDDSAEQVESENQPQALVQEQNTNPKNDLPSASEQVNEQTNVQATTQTNEVPTAKEEAENTQPYYLVTHVIDGDTIEVEIDGVKEKLRLIGIDTPETVDPRKPVECFGIEASNKMKSLVEGKEVRLELDPTQGDRDKYSRLLRYVFLPDNTLVNDTMIREGFANEYTYQIPYQYQTQFKQAEQEARENKRGLWDDGVCDSKVMQTQNGMPQATTPQSPQPVSSPPYQPEPEPAPVTSTCDCSGDIYNCGSFKTHQEAQSVFACCMEQIGKDIHKLDGNNDSNACKSLP